MFELCVKTHFSAAHRLRGYAGSCEAQHGHNWDVEVSVRGETLDDIGLLVDFREVKRAVKTVLDELDHTDLNCLPSFIEENPSSENIARYLYERVGLGLNCERYMVSRISVYETPTSQASYWEP